MIVIKSGKNFPQVYADKAFDKWGTPTGEDIRIVENWDDINIPENAEKIDASLPYDVDFEDYYSMIENTLWIFNNEPITIKKGTVFMTGAGVSWMFQDGNVEIYDISKTQIKFVQNLLDKWDGKDYGNFVYNFIIENKIMHFHVNLNEKQNSDRASIGNKENFVQSINDNFQMLKDKYKVHWTWKPKNIKARFGNILEQVKKQYLGKFLLTNVCDFKYYFAKFYPSDISKFLSPSTKVFIKKLTKDKSIQACEKLNINVPVDIIYEEIQKIKKYLVPHRGDSGMGWKAFCIHGQTSDRTKEDSYYADFLGHRWTDEALEHMPRTVHWLKSLGYKNFKRVRVMCLEPKGFINMHKDQEHSKLGAVNVAITNPKGCNFYLQHHGVLDFNPGTAYSLDVSNYHAVVNDSDVHRYHIIIHGSK